MGEPFKIRPLNMNDIILCELYFETTKPYFLQDKCTNQYL